MRTLIAVDGEGTVVHRADFDDVHAKTGEAFELAHAADFIAKCRQRGWEVREANPDDVAIIGGFIVVSGETTALD